MSPQIITPADGDILRDAPSHTVLSRAYWADDWAVEEHLYCDWCFFGTGSEASTAQLYWRYGEGMQPGTVTFEEWNRKNTALDKYVLIRIDQGDDDPILWHGIIAEIGDKRAGAYSRRAEGQPAPARVPIGEQGLMAYGLDWYLQRTYLHACQVKNRDDGAAYEAAKALTFNEQNAFANTGNRTLVRGSLGAYLFSEDLDNDATYWSSRDIVDYLMTYYAPRDIADQARLLWGITARANTCMPDWDQPVIEAEGKNLFDIFNQLFDQSRLLGWCLKTAGVQVPTLLQIDVFSFNSQPLQLPSGDVQAANPTIVSLDFDRAVDVTQAVIRDSAIHQVEQVAVRGGKNRSVFSLSYQDGTLEGDWTAADVAAYEAGPAVGGLDRADQQRRLMDYRGSDRFERVFSYFRLPADWNYEVGNGDGGTKHRVSADDEWIYRPTLRFERFLPRGFWTSGSGTPTNSATVQAAPIALLKLEDDAGTDRYQHIERLAVEWGIEDKGDKAGRNWGASLRIRQDAPGVIIRVSGAQTCQHFIADSDFTKGLAYDYDAQLDWQDNLILTVMIELDSSAEVEYPPDGELMADITDVARKLYINVGDRARVDWVSPGTVLGHVDGVLQHVGAAGYYHRDDRAWMRDVARLVYEWYSTKRQAFTLVYRQVNKLVSRGDLITTIGAEETEEEVNSIVTGLNFDLMTGTTEITTSFAELDALNF